MENYDEKICRYALHRIFGSHPATAFALMARFGSAVELFSIGGHRLMENIGAGYRDVDFISDSEYEKAESELREVEASGARFLCENDPNYPELLKECHDRPIGLYVRSESPDAEIFGSGRRFIAVIGTRDISTYGSEWCARIVGALARSGDRPVIVSGLALGTDITAHRKALGSGLSTIAVLPTGIETVYPARHIADARRIVSAPGSAVITDYPPKTVPRAFNFLRRNRIIAGICEATILVESKVKGGGMMTARLASSYFRDVYALPGRVEDLRSRGCNVLIRDKIAEPILSEDSIVENLGMNAREKRRKVNYKDLIEEKFSGKVGPEWMEKLTAIILAVKEAGGADIEELSVKCSQDYDETAKLVSLLECEGLIKVDLMQRCNINYE